MRILGLLLGATMFVLMPAGAAQAQYVMDVNLLRVALQIGDLGDAQELDAARTVYVARLSQIAATIGNTSLDKAIANRTRQIIYMRNIVKQNSESMKALEINHATLDQVIIFTTGGNTAMLYVDDR